MYIWYSAPAFALSYGLAGKDVPKFDEEIAEKSRYWCRKEGAPAAPIAARAKKEVPASGQPPEVLCFGKDENRVF